MRTRMVLVAAALAGGLRLVPAVMEQAEAPHGGGGFAGGGHFGGGMGGGHFAGGPNSAGGHVGGSRLVVRWAGHTLPQVPGTAVLGGMQAALLGTAIGTATTCMAMITITSSTTTITSGIAS